MRERPTGIMLLRSIATSSRIIRPGRGGWLIDGDDDHDVQWLTNSCTGRVSEARVHPGRLAVEHGLAVSQPELTLDGMVQTLFVSVPDPPWTFLTGPRAPPAVRL